ncbi:hypothetical protein K466DRAFT_595323 [Polyporus arcularius HHB13444]|uniref:Uncharacterized protein n=1 Tax=Polyporus arcularius HHB13444 TaxID=1314778 RepID=A0A5C3PT66_9APHY|nr:hypothetical protein K466DRAFT_595323 [Polyporus arcularius HHB13444]
MVATTTLRSALRARPISYSHYNSSAMSESDEDYDDLLRSPTMPRLTIEPLNFTALQASLLPLSPSPRAWIVSVKPEPLLALYGYLMGSLTYRGPSFWTDDAAPTTLRCCFRRAPLFSLNAAVEVARVCPSPRLSMCERAVNHYISVEDVLTAIRWSVREKKVIECDHLPETV